MRICEDLNKNIIVSLPHLEMIIHFRLSVEGSKIEMQGKDRRMRR